MCKNIADFTTFGIGGAARRIAVAENADALMDECGRGECVVFGGGSNVLVSDDGYDGTVILNRYADISVSGETVTAGSGARLSVLCKRAASAALTGLEFAVGIPGSVGGAVRMNAGAFGGSIGDSLLYADVLRGGKIVRMTNAELALSYRESALLPSDTVISAAFMLKRADTEAVNARMCELAAIRRRLQPIGKSAGSVFKNPRGMSAGKLIDEAGFKGYSVGGAKVSDRHANIIVNTGGATAKDVIAVINAIKQAVSARGVILKEEIIYIGEFT